MLERHPGQRHTYPDLVPTVREPPDAATVARWAGVGLLAAHGAIHGMGVALLWRWAEPGTLRYADAVPAPGSALGYLAGLAWLVAGVGFIVGAWRLAHHDRRWLPTITGAAVLSFALVVLMAAQAPVGVAFDVAVLATCLWCWAERDRPARADR
jgi:hypothetical protein